jgi:hypothetical protein
VPLAALAPLHPPEAVHAVAFVELHVNVEVPPAATTVGFGFKVAVGTMLTSAVAAGLAPPVPVHVNE